ncbi:unnamed protein product [Amoebophrya sp. A120]|nr:unnamed protein product [Amoebophrya sp. A120]|eukprot:GSA120T00019307001.1
MSGGGGSAKTEKLTAAEELSAVSLAARAETKDYDSTEQMMMTATGTEKPSISAENCESSEEHENEDIFSNVPSPRTAKNHRQTRRGGARKDQQLRDKDNGPSSTPTSNVSMKQKLADLTPSDREKRENQVKKYVKFLAATKYEAGTPFRENHIQSCLRTHFGIEKWRETKDLLGKKLEAFLTHDCDSPNPFSGKEFDGDEGELSHDGSSVEQGTTGAGLAASSGADFNSGSSSSNPNPLNNSQYMVQSRKALIEQLKRQAKSDREIQAKKLEARLNTTTTNGAGVLMSATGTTAGTGSKSTANLTTSSLQSAPVIASAEDVEAVFSTGPSAAAKARMLRTRRHALLSQGSFLSREVFADPVSGRVLSARTSNASSQDLHGNTDPVATTIRHLVRARIRRIVERYGGVGNFARMHRTSGIVAKCSFNTATGTSAPAHLRQHNFTPADATEGGIDSEKHKDGAVAPNYWGHKSSSSRTQMNRSGIRFCSKKKAEQRYKKLGMLGGADVVSDRVTRSSGKNKQIAASASDGRPVNETRPVGRGAEEDAVWSPSRAGTASVVAPSVPEHVIIIPEEEQLRYCRDFDGTEVVLLPDTKRGAVPGGRPNPASQSGEPQDDGATGYSDGSLLSLHLQESRRLCGDSMLRVANLRRKFGDCKVVFEEEEEKRMRGPGLVSM